LGFYRKIKYFLVHTLHYSNKEAQTLIDSGNVTLDNVTVLENCLLSDTAEISVNGEIVRAKKELVYFKFNKPAGFESTLSKDIETNISLFFPEHLTLSIAGRLDKASQGLLLLSNDGAWVEEICNPKFEKEKEYLVTLDKEVSSEFVEQFKTGVRIGNYITQECFCEKTETNQIRVILKEGKNRQIRRMCKKLGYGVILLKRVRIGGLQLAELEEGQWQNIDREL
jgi:23S rRNA pseudouridine2604 synthase